MLEGFADPFSDLYTIPISVHDLYTIPIFDQRRRGYGRKSPPNRHQRSRRARAIGRVAVRGLSGGPSGESSQAKAVGRKSPPAGRWAKVVDERSRVRVRRYRPRRPPHVQTRVGKRQGLGAHRLAVCKDLSVMLVSMKMVLSDISALKYWFVCDGRTNVDSLRASVELDGCPTSSEFQDFRRLLLPYAVDGAVNLLVPSAAHRRIVNGLSCCVWSAPLAPSSLCRVSSELYVVSPEFAFVQMANRLPIEELIVLGTLLCSSFSLDGTSTWGFKERIPLTNSQKLEAFSISVAGCYGGTKARRAARYSIDGAASPREAALATILFSPCRIGGYGIVRPVLNRRIEFGATARAMAGRDFCVCDFYWDSARLALEYDSDTFHTGPDRIARDARRRNALIEQGVSLLVVTNDQVASEQGRDALAQELAAVLRCRLRMGRGFSREANRLLVEAAFVLPPAWLGGGDRP